MNIPVIFQFLKELSANNNREWFNSHREQYEVARSEFENLLTVIISRISLFDESIRGIEAKDCTYRIYRDTRFSEDKTPYKTHLRIYQCERKEIRPLWLLRASGTGKLLVGRWKLLSSPALVKSSATSGIRQYR